MWLGLWAAAVLSGCASSGEPLAPFDGVYEFRMQVASGDTVRSAVVHVPPAYDGSSAFPLVLAFHGSGMTGEEMRDYTGLDGPADSLGFVVAYPDGARNWDVEGAGDVRFTLDLIDGLADRLWIDRGRVYATGFSRGGSFTMRLACDLADRFAAVGIVASTLYADLADRCSPDSRISTALVVGTVDLLVPIDGDSATGRLSADSTIRIFARRNGCSVTGRIVTYEPDTVDDGRRVRREAFQGCDGGSETLLYVVEVGNHAWYRGDVDTGLVLGEMFLRHRR